MSFSLSMNTTTLRPTLTLPKGFMAVSGVSGFSTATRVQLKTRTSGRLSLIVAQSSTNNGPASVQEKYDEVLKEMKSIRGDYIKAATRKVNMWTEFVTANQKAKLARHSWGNKLKEVKMLTVQLREVVSNTSSTSQDVASGKVKHDEAVNELVTLASNFIKAGMKRDEMRKGYATALQDAELSLVSWETRREVTKLQSQLGISVEKLSSSSENDGFASLKVKYDKAMMEFRLAGQKYRDAWMDRMHMENTDESEEEMLALESKEKKRLEVLELQMQMYILRPGITFLS